MKVSSLTLYQRTGLTLAAGLMLFSAFAMAVVQFFVIEPVAERAAEELSALLELSAKVWVELPPWTRRDYERELGERHGLRIGPKDAVLATRVGRQEFIERLETVLARRFEGEPTVLEDPAVPGWYWVELPVGQEVMRLGFAETRLRQQVPVAVLLIFGAGAMFVLVTALLLVRRVTLPLSRLHDAVRRLGRGEPFRPIPESGSSEFADLARRINQTEREVRELLANRTTLLAGISHDLRTPLARMRLALELLGQAADPKLLAGVEADLDEMNESIGRVMELSRGLERQEASVARLSEVLQELAENYGPRGVQVRWDSLTACTDRVPPKVFRRVVNNLLDNAIRYGGGEPVELAATCSPGRAMVVVRDHGPGIPAEQLEAVLRPFHRLEGSRSRDTGGSGLGLAVVRQLCTTYGWTLTLADAPGGGLEARIAIPTNRG